MSTSWEDFQTRCSILDFRVSVKSNHGASQALYADYIMLAAIFRVDLLLRIAWEEQMLLRNTCAKRVD